MSWLLLKPISDAESGPEQRKQELEDLERELEAARGVPKLQEIIHREIDVLKIERTHLN